MRGPSLRTPGRGGGRRGTGGSGRSVTGPLPAPHRAEESGPQFPQFLCTGAAPNQRHQSSTAISRINQVSVRASCRLTQLRCWVAPSVTPCGRASRPQRVKSLRSKVELNLVAIPPHLVTFPPPCGPSNASAIAPATLRSVLGSKATKCSGRPGSGPPLTLQPAGADRAGLPSADLRLGPPYLLPPVRPRLRGYARISGVGLY